MMHNTKHPHVVSEIKFIFQAHTQKIVIFSNERTNFIATGLERFQALND
jgi:hypothetical protein